MFRGETARPSAAPGAAGDPVNGKGDVTVPSSKFADVIGTSAYLTAYEPTGPPPKSAGAVHPSWNDVCRRSSTTAVKFVGAAGTPKSTTTVTLPVPTPFPGMLSVVAVILTSPSRSVTPFSVANPVVVSMGATPIVDPPTENVMLPGGGGTPPTSACTVSEPCQPGVNGSASSMQPIVTSPVDVHSSFVAMGDTKNTTGAMPTVTVHGTGCTPVALPAGSLAT